MKESSERPLVLMGYHTLDVSHLHHPAIDHHKIFGEDTWILPDAFYTVCRVDERNDQPPPASGKDCGRTLNSYLTN